MTEGNGNGKGGIDARHIQILEVIAEQGRQTGAALHKIIDRLESMDGRLARAGARLESIDHRLGAVETDIRAVRFEVSSWLGSRPAGEETRRVRGAIRWLPPTRVPWEQAGGGSNG